MRKYFTNILGNNDAKSRLFEAISTSTLPHAFLITGPDGAGKFTLATEIAAAMNCENARDSSTPLPCGVCNSCRRIREGIFPDVKVLERSGKLTLGVDEVREFREDMFLSATEAKYKFYIIKDADKMTSAAGNAILKVLEEPPSNVHIILLATEADKILTTIKSRTQFIQMEIFDYDRLKEFVLERSDGAKRLYSSDKDKLKGILLASSGVIGNALTLLDEKNIADTDEKRSLVMNFISALPKKVPFSNLYSASLSLPQKRDELKAVFEQILIAIRDMVAVKVSDDVQPLFFLSRTDAEGALGSISAKRLTAIFDIITNALGDIDRNVLIPPLLTDIAVRIKEA